MNQLIFLLLSLIGKKPTVDSVLGAFAKTVTTLEALQAKHEGDIEKHDDAIAKAQAKKAAAEAEIVAAAAAAENIRKLIDK